jgi:hypothetical protein
MIRTGRSREITVTYRLRLKRATPLGLLLIHPLNLVHDICV